LRGKTSVDLAIEKAKEENKAKMREKYKNAKTFVPSVATRPSNFDKVCKQAREREESLLNFKGVKSRPVPKVPNVQVQMNVATILRENALHQKRIDEEKKRAESYEQELRDESEFEEWQARMKRLDEESRRKEIERRRKEMGKIAKAAMEAQKQRIETNRGQAHDLKQLLASLGEQHKKDIESIEAKNKESRAKVIKDKEKVSVIQSKMVEERSLNAYTIKSEHALNLDKITENREAIIALKKEEQEILAQQQSQAATKGAVEEKKFRELTMGAEREIKLKQVEKKKEALIYEATKAKENGIKMAHVQREKHRKKEALDAYDAYVKTLSELRTAETAKETRLKKMKASRIRNHERELRSQLSSRSTLFSRQSRETISRE